MKSIDKTLEQRLAETEYSPYVFEPKRIKSLAIAYKNKSVHNHWSKEYYDSKQKINDYNTNMTFLAKELRLLKKKKGDSEEIKKLENARSYMMYFNEVALDLSTELLNAEKEYLIDTETENKRYKKKLEKLEKDKNRAKRRLEKNKTAWKKAAVSGGKIAAAGAAALSALFEVPGSIYVKGTLATIVGIVTYLPLDLLVNKIENSAYKDISEKFEPLFKEVDKTHMEQIVKLDIFYQIGETELADEAEYNLERTLDFYFKTVKASV